MTRGDSSCPPGGRKRVRGGGGAPGELKIKVHEFYYLTNPVRPTAGAGRKRIKASIWRHRDAFIGRVEELIADTHVKIRWMYRPAVRHAQWTARARARRLSLASPSLSVARAGCARYCSRPNV